MCEGIDDNSTWGEPILTNNCSTLLNANMSQVRSGQLDLMCVCKTVENLELGYVKGALEYGCKSSLIDGCTL
jgi:hypothetical protein